MSERPCRFCIANWAGITTRRFAGEPAREPIRPDPDDCGMAHERNDQTLYDLATAFARACCGTRTPSDEQIGWYLSDADDVVGDFQPPPERWRVRKLPASRNDDEQGIEQRLRINDVTYVALEGGKDCRGQVSRLATYRAQLSGDAA